MIVYKTEEDEIAIQGALARLKDLVPDIKYKLRYDTYPVSIRIPKDTYLKIQKEAEKLTKYTLVVIFCCDGDENMVWDNQCA